MGNGAWLVAWQLRQQGQRIELAAGGCVLPVRPQVYTKYSVDAVGKGVPDLLVGCRGVNLLVEVKVDSAELNDLQGAWHTKWTGQAVIIRSSEQAAELVQTVWAATAEPGKFHKWHRL